MVPNPEKLACISLLVCDDVYRDERTKKLVIVGTFNRILAATFPCQHSRLTVLFTLTNAKGQYNLALYLEHEKTGNRVAELRGPMRIDDPLQISDINVEMQNIVFQSSGKYWVTLEADGAILTQRPFWVETRDDQKRA